MKLKRLAIMLAAVTVAASALAQTAPVSVKWEVGENLQHNYTAKFTFKNVSDKELDGNWAFYFNKFSSRVSDVEGQAMDIKEIINNNYNSLVPNANYTPLKPGEELTVMYYTGGSFRSISDKPDGGHFVYGDSKTAIPVAIEIAELTDPKQFSQFGKVNYPDGNYMYAENKISNPEGVSYTGSVYDIFPAPKQISLDVNGNVAPVPTDVKITINALYISKAKRYLVEKLTQLGISENKKAKFAINVVLRPSISDNNEYYQMEVAKKSITITGQSEKGVLNGIKTLVAVLQRNTASTLPCATIVDYPDFHYRGMMLDISRNYTTYENLLDLIDRLAAYKINVFQFHFSDDEAWRLEIPGLPELTEVSSRKGFTLNDYKAGFLMPTYAGTGNPDDGKAPANGYITRSQFVDMLKYAYERGVKIIPEVETPGHARAAIVAMRHRYDKYINTDPEEANRYRNFDFTDTSRFESAQGFYDNVLNVAEPGTYRFLMKVIKELQSMYSDAGLPLDIVHMGGDEVPGGCWDGSEKIQELKKTEGLTTERDVAEHFFKTICTWMHEQGIKVEGWQEVSNHHSDEYNKMISPMLAGVNVWSTIGKDETIAYNLANKGVPVILSNVNNLYLDLQYRPHEYEAGLSWGGCVDEILSWETLPYNIYRSAQIDIRGAKKDLTNADQGKPALEKPENIVGLQAQLWAETIRDYGMVQSYIFPKIYGLVERAWNARPEWGEGAIDQAKYAAARAQYNLKIGVKELPYLQKSGATFHIAQPGAIVEGGMLKVNTPYPGMTIRYTLDGSIPTANSPVWTAPVAVGDAKLIKVKAYYLGHESVATRLEVK